jgi:hypothetical protein
MKHMWIKNLDLIAIKPQLALSTSAQENHQTNVCFSLLRFFYGSSTFLNVQPGVTKRFNIILTDMCLLKRTQLLDSSISVSVSILGSLQSNFTMRLCQALGSKVVPTVAAQIFFAWPLCMSPARQSNKSPLDKQRLQSPARRPTYRLRTSSPF